MQFQKGQSGKPAARPRGAEKGAAAFRRPHAPFGNCMSALLGDRAHDARSWTAVAYGALHLLQDCLVIRGNRGH